MKSDYECFLSRALLSGSHYVLSLCHCVTLLCYAPVVEQTKMMKMIKGGGALCAGNAVALLVFGPVMP